MERDVVLERCGGDGEGHGKLARNPGGEKFIAWGGAWK